MWAIHAWHVRTLKDRGNRMRIEWGEQDNRIRSRNTSVGSVRLRIVALASVGGLMSNTTALALRTRYTMYSTNKSSPYSGLLVATSKCVIWMRCMSNDPVTQWPVRFRQYCPYHDSDYVWASQSSTRSEWTEKNKRSNIDMYTWMLHIVLDVWTCTTHTWAYTYGSVRIDVRMRSEK